jgi:hypothetical protein
MLLVCKLLADEKQLEEERNAKRQTADPGHIVTIFI